MAEEQNVDQQAPEAPPAPAAPDPWQPWQQAGFTPDQNPYELRQHLDWVQAITDESRHELELERSLREWGHLPEGVSLREMKEWAAQQAAQRQDPFGAPVQPQYPGMPQNGYPTPPAYEDPYAQQPQGFDPQQLRQGVEQIIEQRLAQERAQFEQQMAARDMQNQLNQQLERASSQHSFTDADRTWVQREMGRRIQFGEVQTPQQFATLVEDVWRDLADYRQQVVAGALQAQQGAPRTMTPTGATPGTLPPANGIAGALERTAATLGIQRQP